ncbi:N-acetyltransferase [Sporosarcina aquimarina]|uniref:GNAT family N-acetyltransferase n=1 Tax=Sporosarcina aquimarina TaxID=114975 RepID=UPI00203B28FD|nr:GNAT family N-acetyltransferase [Sporosarcina aquimarina]MCM3758829.1 N-acetyltransferase [Sporosarcina aquimarina]
MEFEYKDLGGDAYAFRKQQDGKTLAEITWTLLGDVMVMDHTFVSEELRGGGVAKKLLDRAADYARENNLKMEAVCSYVVTAFNRYEEYNDVKA